MHKVNRRKYLYENQKSKVVCDTSVHDLNVIDAISISDEEALFKANQLTVEAQNKSFNHKSSNSTNNSRMVVSRKNRTKEYQDTLKNNTTKESRVPGLYGCNRYKSKRKQLEKESEIFCFF